MHLINFSQKRNRRRISLYASVFLHSFNIKIHFGGTPLNSRSLITVLLEWVHQLSSFLLKRILKYTVIKIHSASFFLNGWNGADKVPQCISYTISLFRKKTKKPKQKLSNYAEPQAAYDMYVYICATEYKNPLLSCMDSVQVHFISVQTE